MCKICTLHDNRKENRMNEFEKLQAVLELAQSIDRAVVDIGQTIRYGYRPSPPTDQDIKDSIDAINKYVKDYSKNANEIRQCEFLFLFMKSYIDFTGNRGRW